MKIVNYIVSIALIVLWVVGFFKHFAGYSIHFLLIAALILILYNIVRYDGISDSEKKQINNHKKQKT